MTIIITDLADRRRVKRWNFERKVLRKLSLAQLKSDIEFQIGAVVPFFFSTYPFLIDPCMDIAIDAYLIGAEYSRFGYMGEREESVRSRCDDEVTDVIDALFNLLQGWIAEQDHLLDELYPAAKGFIESWWSKGFNEGEIHHKLRLH